MWNDMVATGGAKHIKLQWLMLDSVSQGVAPFLVFGFLAVALLWSEGARDVARSDLLGKYRRQNDTVIALDFSNPFSFALGMKPAWGGFTCLPSRSTFDDTHRPSAERCFGHASLVMLPKKLPDQILTTVIPRLYGPYLASHFQLIAETALGQLYRHND
jgi:hypothetical protein